MARTALRILNGIYGLIIGTLILVTAVFAGYSIWDNFQVYRSAEYVQNQIRQLKPDKEAEGGQSFDELRKINSDVIGWITVENTNIDYPVLQGDTNLTYMNKDVYGNFSLAGSLFLDNRNSADFSDNYSLIYGHNMDEHLMFGDLALFKDKEFFKNNTDAVLITPEETKDLKVMAILQIPAGKEEIFNPTVWRDSLKGLDDFIRKNSIWYHSDMVDLISECPKFVEVVSLVTCSDGSTNDRTVLILIHEKPDGGVAGDETVPDDENSGDDSYSDDDNDDNYNNDNSNDDDYDGNGNGNGRDDIGGNGSKQTGDTQNEKLWIYLIIGTVIFIISFEAIERYIKKFRDTEN